MHSQFETDYCHYVFPCFDQPDLKASWTLTTIAPENWVVVSNEIEKCLSSETASQTLNEIINSG